MTDLKNKISEQLKKMDKPLYCTLSTVDGFGNPYGAPVYFAYDETNGCLYFGSGIETQHSKNIDLNSKVYVTLFKENLPWGSGDTYGLYIQGTARRLLNMDDIVHAREVLCNRVQIESTYPETFTPPHPRGIYCISVEEVWTNNTEVVISYDGGRHGVDTRVEIV